MYLSEVYLKDQFADLKAKPADTKLKKRNTLERMDDIYRLKNKDLNDIIDYGMCVTY